MSKSESWKAWTAIILILFVSGLIAAVWPYLTGLGIRGASGVPVEPETIVISIPPMPVSGLDGSIVIEMGSYQAFLILALVVVVSVVVVGIVIGVINYLTSRLVTRTVKSDQYQERNAAFQQHENEKILKKREGREAANSQQNDYSRWAVIATSLIILMFAAFLGYLFAGTLFRTGEITQQDQIVDIASFIIGAFILVTLLILILRMNPRRLAVIDETDYSGIPWETITVILLGVLVLGLGIGLLVYVNIPL